MVERLIRALWIELQLVDKSALITTGLLSISVWINPRLITTPPDVRNCLD